MTTLQQSQNLNKAAAEYHKHLVELARVVDAFRELTAFITECVLFDARYIQPVTGKAWADGPVYLRQLGQQADYLVSGGVADQHRFASHMVTTASTIATIAYGHVVDHRSFYETQEPQSALRSISVQYLELVSGAVNQHDVQEFLSTFNPTAQGKFVQALGALRTLKLDEDAQGPVLMMRSAVRLTLDALLKMASLSNSERGDVTNAQRLPVIAKHLAKDELAKQALLDASPQFQQLTKKLAATKELPISRAEGEPLVYQAVALLHTIAESVRVPVGPRLDISDDPIIGTQESGPVI